VMSRWEGPGLFQLRRAEAWWRRDRMAEEMAGATTVSVVWLLLWQC